jgi:predicted transcriptional regulator
MKRSKLRRMIDVLTVVDDHEPVVLNRLVGMTNINYVVLMAMLADMERKGLVAIEVIGKGERPYKRLVSKTAKGSKARRDYEALLENLGGIA